MATPRRCSATTSSASVAIDIPSVGRLPLRVVPDWVCEILSTEAARFDLVKKHRTLHAHGVAPYWIVDPEHETLTVHRHHADGYVTVMTGSVGDVIRAEPFDGVELDVSELFGKETR